MRALAVIATVFAAATAANAASPPPVFYAAAQIGSWSGVVSSTGARYTVPGYVSFAPDRAAVVSAVGAHAIRIRALGGGARVVATPALTAPPVYGPTDHVAYAAGTVIHYVGGPAVRAVGLPRGSRIVELAISPDASLFAATVEWGDGKAGTLQNALYVVSPSGTKRIASGFDAYDTRPGAVWNPDGDKLAFTRGGDVWVVNSNGTSPVQLSHTKKAQEYGPVWSPDGTQVAYTSTRNGVNEAYVAQLTGGERRLTHTPPAPRDAPHSGTHAGAWSPDGSQLAVVTYNSLGVVPASGGAERIVQTFSPRNSVSFARVAWPTAG